MSGKYDVQIQLKSTIDRADSPEEKTEVKTSGYFYIKNGAYYLKYKEEADAGEKISTTVKVLDDEALIIRSGPISMRQHLVPGEVTEGFYRNPLGDMMMSTKTHRCDAQWKPEEGVGTIKLSYDLDMQQQPIGHFQLIFTIWEVQS